MAGMKGLSMLRVSSLWETRSKAGRKYIKGPWGSLNVLVFENDRKRDETHPDYHVCFAVREKSPESAGGSEVSAAELSSEDRTKSRKIPVGGLWANRTRDGRRYFRGNWGGVDMLLFANNRKTDDRQPDYHMFLAHHEKRPDPAAESTGAKVEEMA